MGYAMMGRSAGKKLLRWLDNNADQYVDESETSQEVEGQPSENGIDWLRVIPFVILHLACFAVMWVGWSFFAVIFAVALYGLRMFAITGFYHRYFSHKAFRTSRLLQFIFA